MIGSARKHVIALAAAALVAVAVSACGGGPPNNGPPPPPYMNVDLSDLMSDATAAAGTITIKAGEHADRGDIRFKCAAAGDDCVVKVAVDDDTITAMYRSSGGVVTAVDVPPMNFDVDLSPVTPGFVADEEDGIEIDAGESVVHGDIEITCPAGGEDCTVKLEFDDDGILRAESTGGMATAMNSEQYDVDVSVREEIAGLIEESAGVDPLVNVIGASSSGLSGSGHLQLEQSHRHLYAFGVPWKDDDGGLNFSMSLGGEELPADAAIDYHGRWISGTSDDLISHDLGGASQIDWKLFRTLDVDEVGTMVVVFATDVEESESPGRIWDGYGPALGQPEIRLTDVPPIQPGHDWQGVSIDPGSSEPGTLGGVDGVFSCYPATDGCSLETVASETTAGYYPNSGTVVFTPSDGSTPEMLSTGTSTPVDVVDYLSFGFWLYGPHDADESASYDFGVFAGGGDPFDPTDVAALEGSATYVGDAVGMHASVVTSDYVQDGVEYPVSGTFTADVTLTAEFGSDTEAGTLSGEVHDIAYGDQAASSDVIYLREAPIQVLDGVQVSGDASGTESGSSSMDGVWQAAFFGNDSSDPTAHPTGVAGTFGVDSDDRFLVGAFGAHRQ